MATLQARGRLAVLVLAITVTALGGCASFHSWRKCGSGCPGDAELAAAVGSGLHEHTEFLAPNSVYVRVIDGVVYLSGQVATDLQRDDAERVARQTPGVHHVVDIIGLEYPGW
ncbi:MAG TPA: BON domain-containing protein [Steroidobacteraceae bacterium]|nr:BON domain-containing protein [Steroidobacteraceae bacterium]